MKALTQTFEEILKRDCTEGEICGECDRILPELIQAVKERDEEVLMKDYDDSVPTNLRREFEQGAIWKRKVIKLKMEETL